MTIDKLIEEGKKILQSKVELDEHEELYVIYAKNYTKWSQKTRIFLQNNCNEKSLNTDFDSLFSLDDEFISEINFEKSINILEAIKDMGFLITTKTWKDKNELLKELDSFIAEGESILNSHVEFDEIDSTDVIFPRNYTRWSLKAKTFLQRYCNEKSLKNDFSSLFYLDDDYIEKINFEKAVNILEAVRETDSIKVQEVSNDKNNLLFELKTYIDEATSFYNNLVTYKSHISTGSYIKWSEKVILFLKKHCLDSDYFNEFETIFSKKKTSINKTEYNKGIKLLELIFEKNLLSLNKPITPVKKLENKKIEKIFISHATKDKDYIKLFVQLLNDIGIPKSSKKIFCSSLEGYNIPLDHDIYEHIKSQFDGNIRVIFMLSKNYYNSIACLNEMGATWINSKEYTTLFLPEFIPESIKGAINPNRIGFYLDDYEKLNSFRDKIIKEFDLKTVDHSIWERDRNKFIEEIQNLLEQKKSNNSTSDIEMKIESIEEDHEGNNILLCTRIINNSQFNYKLKEFDLFLTDTRDEKEEITHKEHLEIYSYENRIVKFQLPKRNEKFKGNRTKNKKIDPIFTK